MIRTGLCEENRKRISYKNTYVGKPLTPLYPIFSNY